MPVAHLLEDFGAGSGALAPNGMDEEQIEVIRLESFEQGYKAGWDDSLKAQADDSTRISADLARNLQDLSFTYHEARAHVLQAMEPLLDQLVGLVLPELARQSIGARVQSELMEMARGQAVQIVNVVTAPDNAEVLQQLSDQDFGFPITVEVDPGLATGQVHLRLGDSERQIDMAAVLDGIAQAVAGFKEESEKDAAHG